MSGLDHRDHDLLRHLHETRGATISQLGALLGVTRTAVRVRLNRMESAGMVETEQISEGRGRPSLVFRLTDVGRESLGEDYRELAVILWEVISAVESASVREELLAAVRDRLVARADSREPRDQERLTAAVAGLNAAGFNFDTDTSGSLPILRERNCPFPRLADVDEAICDIERSMLEGVLGAEVRFRSRCRDGGHCCEFEVGSPVGAGADSD